MSGRYRKKVSLIRVLAMMAVVMICGLDRTVSLSEENNASVVDRDAIMKAYARQRRLLMAADITCVFSGDLLVDQHVLWEQYGITSFRQGKERFAFKGTMRRYDYKRPRLNLEEMLSLPRPTVLPKMSTVQRKNALTRQKVYDQNKKLYQIITTANIKKGPDSEVASTIYNGRNIARINEGATPLILGPDQLEMFAGAYQVRFLSFWGMYCDDPTLSGAAKLSQKVVSLPDVINDNRMSLKKAELQGKPMILLEGVSGLEGMVGLAAGDRCWLDPGRDYVVTRREFFDTATNGLKTRMDFDDYKLFENGLWLPHRITYTRFGLTIGATEYIGKPLVSDILEVTSVTLNEDVSDDVFDIRIPAGMKVFDFEHGTGGQAIEYISGGGAELLVGHDKKKTGGKLLWLVAANVLVAIVIVFLILYRRRYRE